MVWIFMAFAGRAERGEESCEERGNGNRGETAMARAGAYAQGADCDHVMTFKLEDPQERECATGCSTTSPLPSGASGRSQPVTERRRSR